MSDEVFIGFVEDYEKYQEAKGVEAGGASEDKTIRRISYDDMELISDEDLKILQTTKTRHDLTVYMQSRTDFYDDYYHEDPDSYETLLSEVKKLRRVYVNYHDFLRAWELRDSYMESLIDKYGGPRMFDVYYTSGLVMDWIPPEPQLSKRSKDYDRYINGDLSSVDGEYQFELFHELLDKQIEDMGIHPEELVIRGDVATDPIVLRQAEYGHKVDTSSYRGTNNINGVSTSDLNALQQMFRQWYKNDDDNLPKVDVDKSQWFRNTPEAIRARYYTQPLIHVPIKLGDDPVENDLDPDEMVVDPVLNRPMTRREYNQREFVRMLSDAGWSELRLMRYLGVGSKYEQKLMFMKQKNRRAAKKKATDLVNSILGNDYNDIEFISSTDGLRGVLFDD